MKANEIDKRFDEGKDISKYLDMSQRAKFRDRLINAEIKRIIKLISEHYQPEKIILFGSVAKGNVRESSDIDLLIVKKTNKNFLNRIDEVLQLIHPRVGLDLFVLTPGEIAANKEQSNPYIEEILNEGTVLYEKAS